MKVKIKNHTSSHYTFNSPYPGENGKHVAKFTQAHCGNCDRVIEEARFYQSWNYCPYCGVTLEWPENERRK